MKKILSLITLFFLTATIAAAQIENPVSWSTKAEKGKTEGLYELFFNASIAKPWHLYDMGPYVNGPNATTFTFESNASVELVGPLKQIIKPKKIYDDIFGMEIGYYSGSASFSQTVRVKGAGNVKFRASVEYQVCDDRSCLAPEENDFSFDLEGVGTSSAIAAEQSSTDDSGMQSETDIQSAEPGAENPPGRIASAGAAENTAEMFNTPTETTGSMWAMVIAGIILGFTALLTPCVFPMVPMTVSFFLKSSGNARRGRFMAALYGISIVVLYTLPIAAIIVLTRFIGGQVVRADIFNWIATHWVPNVLFFIVFMVFAASFFGAFEIRLPGKLVNRSDAQADKGGLAGVFFMALTLVLVSFSCTGPIVGSVLIKSISGEIWGPVIVMLAFSIAFAIPFTLFAFFPSFLAKIPKSGNWLNSVKVVLGFVEIALGFKFLSIADQTYHWGLLDREVFLAIWITVFSLMGLYLLGKLKFRGDGEFKFIGVVRLGLAITVFSFVTYMIPGMFGAPLKAISGYLPPMSSQDFVVGTTPALENETRKVKHSDFLSLPHGLSGFFDYEEALEYARKAGKPLLVNISGLACVNCREMESRVWSDPKVLDLLRENYVIATLYLDSRKELPAEKWVTRKDGKVLKTLGRINSHFVAKKFGINSQPSYIILDGNEQILTAPRGYNLNVNEYIQFLEEGIMNYRLMDRH